MSHPFGDLLTQHLHRKHGLSQSKLAAGILQSPSIITDMSQGKRLNGPQARQRVTEIIAWLQQQGALESLDEANALLVAAGMSPLRAREPSECSLLEQLRYMPSTNGSSAFAISPSLAVAPPRKPNPPAPLTNFVGREQEWRSLQAAWEMAGRGCPHCVLITGEAGIGKSRLAAELRNWVAQQGVATAHTRSYAAEGGLAYAPIIEWLRSEAVYRHLHRLDTIWLSEVARLLPELLIDHPHLPRPEAVTASWQRHRLFDALAAAILVGNRPLLLVIDDLQWCDQETLEWLRFLLRYDAQARCLIVGTARSDEIDSEHPLDALLLNLRNDQQLTEIALAPLTQAETVLLAQQTTGGELAHEQGMQLYQATEGNPLFVVEMARARLGLSETRSPVAGAIAQPATVDVRLPPKIQVVIQSRLAHLSPPALDLARLAATIGRQFTFDVLARASERSEEDLIEQLDELCQRQIIREQGANIYDFGHDKLREVAYGEVSAARRRFLHRRVAQALEAVHAESIDRVSGQLAVHYEQAGVVERAIAYCERAAQAAQQVYATYEAIHYLQRGLALLAQLPNSAHKSKQELTFLFALGPALVGTHGYGFAQVQAVYARAQALAHELGQPPNPAILRGLALYFVAHRQFARTYEFGEQLLQLAQQTPEVVDPILCIEGHYVLGVTTFWWGEFARSRSHFETVIAAYDVQQHKKHMALYAQDPGVVCLVRLAWTLWYLGYPDQAAQRAEEARRLAQTIGHPYTTGYALSFLTWLACDRRDWPAAETVVTVLEALCRKHGFEYWLAVALVLKGRLQVERGAVEEGIAFILEGMAAQQVADVELYLPYSLSALATGLSRATFLGVAWRSGVSQALGHFPAIAGAVGNLAMGLAALEEALATVAERGDRWYEAELHRLQGELLLARGDPADAVAACFQRALNLARQQQTRSLELRAVLSLSRLWAKQGKHSEAQQLLAAIYGWFSEGFETADLQEAKALLNEQS